MKVLVIAILFGALFIGGCVGLIGDGTKTCNVDSDCVRATCCHATDVINKNYAPDCSAVTCTASCETVLDCGCGEPVCINNVCQIRRTDLEGCP